MSVKVAVRVRPFNDREKNKNAVCCITMQDPKTIITDVETGNQRDFTFDFSYWSHDGYEAQPNGYLKSTGYRYAEQKHVYEQVSRDK